MPSQKWIENRILQLLEKHGFLSGKQLVQRMPGVDIKDIWETVQILLRGDFIGKVITSKETTLYFIEEDD